MARMSRSARDAATRRGRATSGERAPVRLLVARRRLDLKEALALERNTFSRDWFGAPVLAAASFVIVVDPERLYYVAECPQTPDHDASLLPGAFASGLWRRDVAELFIGAAGSPAYLELNLSPGGAWWSCAFSSYRQPDPSAMIPPAGVETFAQVGPEGWTAGLAVPRAALGPAGRFGREARVNVCMIIGGARRQHLCWRPTAGEPDFHGEPSFVELEPVQI